MDVEKLSQEINQLSQIKWLSHDDAVIVFEFARCIKLLTEFEAKVRADERKSPTITKLVQSLDWLQKEACALIAAHEIALRQDSGNTNIACLQLRIDEARAALAELEKP